MTHRLEGNVASHHVSDKGLSFKNTAVRKPNKGQKMFRGTESVCHMQTHMTNATGKHSNATLPEETNKTSEVLGMVVHACNGRPREIQAVHGHPRVYSKFKVSRETGNSLSTNQ